MGGDRRSDDLEASDPVNLPTKRPVVPVGKDTAALVAIGAGVGGAVAGTAGAVVGGGVGWALDAIRRRLIA